MVALAPAAVVSMVRCRPGIGCMWVTWEHAKRTPQSRTGPRGRSLPVQAGALSPLGRAEPARPLASPGLGREVRPAAWPTRRLSVTVSGSGGFHTRLRPPWDGRGAEARCPFLRLGPPNIPGGVQKCWPGPGAKAPPQEASLACPDREEILLASLVGNKHGVGSLSCTDT